MRTYTVRALRAGRAPGQPRHRARKSTSTSCCTCAPRAASSPAARPRCGRHRRRLGDELLLLGPNAALCGADYGGIEFRPGHRQAHPAGRGRDRCPGHLLHPRIAAGRHHRPRADRGPRHRRHPGLLDPLGRVGAVAAARFPSARRAAGRRGARHRGDPRRRRGVAPAPIPRTSTSTSRSSGRPPPRPPSRSMPGWPARPA